MESKEIKSEIGRLKSNLLYDFLLTLTLPLVIVIGVMVALKALRIPTLEFPASGFDLYAFAALPELSFATLFIWALARRRLTECMSPPAMQMDAVVFFFVALSSISLVFVLIFTWTTSELNGWLLIFQSVLLVGGVMFNFLITKRDLKRLRSLIEADSEE
ncbi:MAG: hypothetical protein JYX80_13020 [Candidatus Scalindua sediminis]|nr:hypothetical protein [Candidatus Scalindua sediminis]